MSALSQALADYLTMRRALGYKLEKTERLLGQYIIFVEDRGEEHLTTETALTWATWPAGADVIWTSRRLAEVRIFARHLHVIDPAHQVPPADLLPARTRRATPYLYVPQEISDLMKATTILRGLHLQATYRTLIGLLAATGMRVGEAIGLDHEDFDAAGGILTVRNGKSGKSRELPLLVFASERKGREPCKLEIDDLDAPLIGTFLDHLESHRKNGARTRNARLAAIRSPFRYAALRHPEHAAVIERVLAIPPKRFDRRLVTFLTETEMGALLAAPDRMTRTGRRDAALFALAVQTGLRASELIGLCGADVHLGSGAHVSCNGKGRKQRITPLTKGSVAILRAWLAERAGQPAAPLFTR